MKKTVGGLVAVLLLATACSSSGGNGVPSTPNAVESNSQWDRVGGSDSYVYTTCDHGHRIYWATSDVGESIAVVDQDPTCN